MYLLKHRPDDFPFDENELDPDYLDTMRKVELQRRSTSMSLRSGDSSSSLSPSSPVSSVPRAQSLPATSSVDFPRAQLGNYYMEFADRTDAEPIFVVSGSTRIYAPCDPEKTGEEFSFCIDNSQLEPDLRELMGPKPSDWVVDFICPNEAVYRLWMGTFLIVSEHAPVSLFRDALPVSQRDLHVDPTRFVKRESVWSNTPFDHVRVTVRLVATENPRESVWEPIQLIGRPFDTLGTVSIRLFEEFNIKVDEFVSLDPRLTLRELSDHLGHTLVTALCPQYVLRKYQDRVMQANAGARSPVPAPITPPVTGVSKSSTPSSNAADPFPFIPKADSFLLQPAPSSRKDSRFSSP
jgi:hypothetical protein